VHCVPGSCVCVSAVFGSPCHMALEAATPTCGAEYMLQLHAWARVMWWLMLPPLHYALCAEVSTLNWSSRNLLSLQVEPVMLPSTTTEPALVILQLPAFSRW
jgi:hypothetical protein